MTYEAGVLDASRGGSTWTSFGVLGPVLRTFHIASGATSTAWPANNDAYLVPFLIDDPVTFTGAFFMAGTSPGTTNYDLGIYRDDFTLVRSLGATAAVNTTDAILPAAGGTFSTAVTLVRGRYYMAMSAASTALTVRAAVNGNQFFRALGMFKMATAHPLPAPFVPASMSTTAFMPAIGLMTAANTVL